MISQQEYDDLIKEITDLKKQRKKWLKICEFERKKWFSMKELAIAMNANFSQETIEHQQNIADLLGEKL